MKKKQVYLLVALVYGGVLLCNIVYGLYSFTADSIARANGTLQTQQLSFDDFETQLMEVQSATRAVTDGEDPQLILRNLGTKCVSVRFDISFSKNPGEVTLYYAAQGEDFSKEKKIWGKAKSDGSYTFALPRTDIAAVRIDPTNMSGVEMNLNSFTLNAPHSFFSYFKFTYEDAFFFLIYPGLAAAFLGYFISEFWPALQSRLYKKKV